MLFYMGNIANHIKMMERKHSFQQKKKDPGQMAGSARADGGGGEKPDPLSPLAPGPDAHRNMALDSKLNAGKRLTQSEMQDLRDNDPALYAKAQRIETERAFYERTLRICLTKDQVRAQRMSKIASLAGEIKDAVKRGDGQACGEIHQRQAAMAREHGSFLRTRQYAGLPENHHELAARRRLKIKTLPAHRERYPAQVFLYDQSANKQAVKEMAPSRMQLRVSSQRPAAGTGEGAGESREQTAGRPAARPPVQWR